jgi:hypothetical protein
MFALSFPLNVGKFARTRVRMRVSPKRRNKRGDLLAEISQTAA